MIAGPNGSGKSKLKAVLNQDWLGTYINADEIQTHLSTPAGLDLSLIGVNDPEIIGRLANSSFQSRAAKPLTQGLSLHGNVLQVDREEPTSYLAAALADLARHDLLQRGESLTFETVMSHESKIDLLRFANELGYRTYLYFVATESVEINIARVRSRVLQGGHDVPDQKIRERYEKSLQLLPRAIQASYRSFVFDNSGGEDQGCVWIAEFMPDDTYEYKSEKMPTWFMTHVDQFMENEDDGLDP